MQIIAVTTGSYPFGGASTNRHLSYLKGLANLNTDVRLLVLQPDKNQSVLSDKPDGTYAGIHFKYTSWYIIPIRSIFLKIYYTIKAHIRAVKIIKREIVNIGSEIKLIILLANPFEILPYLYISKKHNIPIFHERTEYPFIEMNGFIKKMQLTIYLKYIIPKLDGIYVISKSLVEYFSKYVSAKEKILHLPMTVEFERFITHEKVDNNKFGKYIAYCGSMYSDKDGVLDLIEAFNIFCHKNTNTNLLLIGDNSNKMRFSKISYCINSSPFKHRIFCTGWIDKNEIPGYLINAEVLALARPDNVQARGGFPTKLGEYLASGNPVVITDVGEHTDYLTDGISAYISRPNNPVSFAEKLLTAINNYVDAKRIGAEGRKVALHQFNYQTQARKLYDFLNSVQYHA